MRFLLIKTGSAIPTVLAQRQDFEVWVAQGAGLAQSALQSVNVFRDEALPEPNDVPAVIVSGSAAMVTDRADWSERTAAWLQRFVELGRPVLGICYGHQLLAHALGGEVQNNPNGRQIGTIDVQLNAAARSDALFGALPDTLHLPVCHVQSVVTLPNNVTLLGQSARDPHHIFRAGDSAWGVQFHPEFDADIVRGYVDARRDQIDAEGLDSASISRSATDTADGARVLQRFVELASARF